MNTVEELTNKYAVKTAQMMIDSYEKRIGSGVLRIEDINYIGDREIKLVCTLCGKVYTPLMKSGRNYANNK